MKNNTHYSHTTKQPNRIIGNAAQPGDQEDQRREAKHRNPHYPLYETLALIVHELTFPQVYAGRIKSSYEQNDDRGNAGIIYQHNQIHGSDDSPSQHKREREKIGQQSAQREKKIFGLQIIQDGNFI